MGDCAFLRGKYWDSMMNSNQDIESDGQKEAGERALEGGFLMATESLHQVLAGVDSLFESAVAAFIPMHLH